MISYALTQLHRRRVFDVVKTLRTIPQMCAAMATIGNNSNRHHLEVTQGAERNLVMEM